MGKPFIIVDSIICGEDHLPEEYSINIYRILSAIGVNTFYMITELVAVPKFLKSGKAVCIKNFLPYSNRNVLIGPNENAWGPRFLDVSRVLSTN